MDPGLHPDGTTALQHDAAGLCLDDDAGAAVERVLEVRDERGSFRTAPTPHAAVAALVVLRAAAHVARQQVVMPPQPLEPADQGAVATARRGVSGVDLDAAGHRIERPGVLRGGEVRQAVLARPFLPHPLGGVEARRVIHHGAPAQTTPLQDDEAEIVRAPQPPRVVQAFQRVGLAVAEVGFVGVAPLLEHDHALAGGRELAGHDAAARARADDDHVAVECRGAGDGKEPDGLRLLAGWRDRAGVTQAGPRRVRAGRVRGRVGQDGGEALERLERFPLERQPAGGPAVQVAFALARREAGEGARDAAQDEIRHAAVEQPEESPELRPIGRPRE